MSPEALELAKLIVTAFFGFLGTVVVAYIAGMVGKQGKAIDAVTKSQEVIKEDVSTVKVDVGVVKTTTADIILRFDPLTRTLDGQFTKIQKDIEEFGNQKGRTELLAEQAVEEAAIAKALAEQAIENAATVAAHPSVVPQSISAGTINAPTPVQVEIVPNKDAPVPVVVTTPPMEPLIQEVKS